MKNKRIKIIAVAVLVTFVFCFCLTDTGQHLLAQVASAAGLLPGQVVPLIFFGSMLTGAGEVIIVATAVAVGSVALVKKITKTHEKVVSFNIERVWADSSFSEPKVASMDPRNNPEFLADVLRQLLDYYLDDLEDHVVDEFKEWVDEKVSQGELPPQFKILSNSAQLVAIGKDFDAYRLFEKMPPISAEEKIDALFQVECLLSSNLRTYEIYNYEDNDIIEEWPWLLDKGIAKLKYEEAKQEVKGEVGKNVKKIEQYRLSLEKELVNVNITQVKTDSFPALIAYVSVYDGGNNPFKNLSRNDFEIYDNWSKVSNFSVLSVSDELLNRDKCISLIFDVSGSMEGEALNQSKRAGLTFLRNLQPYDKVAVLSFNARVTCHKRLSDETEDLAEVIESFEASGDTAVYDAVVKGVDEVKGSVGRKAIVLLSDGIDNNSRVNLEDAIYYAQKNGVSVFTVALGDFDQDALIELAKGTGGRMFYSISPESLSSLYERISDLVNQEYKIDLLAVPSNYDISRTLVVTVKANDSSGSDIYSYSAGGGLEVEGQ